MLVGLHASHEAFAPTALLQAVRRAEDAGFGAAMASDHLHPWTEASFAQSAFAWAWLGAALQATGLSFGVVTAPGQRYHPAIVAQAAATLAVMFPGRFWLAAGSGEALNEHVTGDPWPPKAERHARLVESVEVMRALWRGETVTHEGRVRVSAARLYTRPAQPPDVLGAAITAATAEWVGAWADGLITVGGAGDLRRNIEAFHRGGGRGKRVVAQLAVAWGRSETEAVRVAHARWRHAALEPDQLADLPTPGDFDRAAASITPAALRARLRITADTGRVRGWIEEAAGLGCDEVYLSPIVEDLGAFIEAMGRDGLLASRAA